MSRLFLKKPYTDFSVTSWDALPPKGDTHITGMLNLRAAFILFFSVVFKEVIAPELAGDKEINRWLLTWPKIDMYQDTRMVHMKSFPMRLVFLE